ncbi:Uncharacterised protein [Mycobacteroides abscessus]|nr:Uncharacterised protein [Mycobacteroides abscessus]
MATSESRKEDRSTLRRTTTAIPPKTSAAPATTRTSVSIDGLPGAPNTAKLGPCASNSRHTTASPVNANTVGNTSDAAEPLTVDIRMINAARLNSNSPVARLRSVALTAATSSPGGISIHSSPYATMPIPLAAPSTAKANRTRNTGTSRWSASPPATPATTRPPVRRRNGGAAVSRFPPAKAFRNLGLTSAILPWQSSPGIGLVPEAPISKIRVNPDGGHARGWAP